VAEYEVGANKAEINEFREAIDRTEKILTEF